MELIETLKGQKYGHLTILDETEPYISPSGYKQQRVLCQCDCGQTRTTSLISLKKGKCVQCKNPIHRTDMSIIGKRFGHLVVVNLYSSDQQTTYWTCKCDCGNEKVIPRHLLINHHTQSCGCYLKTRMKKLNYSHGLSYSRIYSVWGDMKQRCTNFQAANYYLYGGRGIQVCEAWNNFENFYQWAITNGYQDTLSLERIDVNGNYEPNNCTWIPLSDQCENRRNSKKITYNNETHTISRWAQLLHIPRSTLEYRIKKNNLSDLEKYFQTE